MFRIIVLVLCYHHALSQPVSSDVSTRIARELIECCPCPGTRNAQDWLGDSQLARAGNHCPCMTRGADSDGASSLFFPNAQRPDVSQMRPSDTKEDPKNLLEPEVTLATSVLDTLREVTEEEYRDALEREAAKNALNLDPVPEESARNVVIVLNPKNAVDDEDFISEASHVHESRCIHPIESTALEKSSANQINILAEPFKLPKLKHLELPQKKILFFDSDLGASNIEESVADPSGNLLKFSPDAPELRHTIPLKNILDNQSDSFKNRKLSLINLGNFDDNESKQGFRLSLVPKSKLHINHADDDLRSAPSTTNQVEFTTNKRDQLFENHKLPLTLRNLLKLRDVELIPKSIRNKSWAKSKVDVSKFAIPTLFKNNINENCNGEKKNVKDINLTTDNINYEQRKISDINDTSETDVTDGLQNSRDESMRDINIPFNNIITDMNSKDNIDNGRERDDIRGKDLNLDTLSSPSQIQSSFMKTDNQMDVETTAPLKSDCLDNYVQLKESNTNNELKEIQEQSLETDLNSPEFGNAQFVTENNSHFEDTIQARDFSQHQDMNVDSETDSSNAVPIVLVPVENTLCGSEERQGNIVADSESIERHVTDNKVIPQILEEITDDNDVEPSIKKVPSLSNILLNLRENVKQLENLKKPSLNSELLKTFDENNNGNENKVACVNDNAKQQITNNMNMRSDDDNNETDNVSNISMSDLQTMSDKLLNDNINDQSKVNAIESIAKTKTDETNSKESDIHERNDSELSETKLNSIDIKEKEKACLTNLEAKNADLTESNDIKSVVQDKQQREMETGASNTVINTLPGILDVLDPNLKLRTPLLSDITLPAPNDSFNLLGKPLGDVLNLNTNLPSLDDLRERLVNIFNSDNGSLENDSSSLETDFTNESLLKTMASEASTKKSHKEVPLLKQLESLNHNINKPKTGPFDTLGKSRIIDLNSYRAHLPSPNSLDLKPLKIVPKVRHPAGKNKPSNDLKSDRTILRKVKPTLFSNPLDSLRHLEDFRNNLLSNKKNFLSSPVHSNLNLLPGHLRSNDIEDVAKTIRLNTEKTFKELQRKMKMSLKKPSLGDTLTNPQELLDDMNDKLKGIHYDLNDRLSSIRENILDSARLRTIEQPRKVASKNVMLNSRKSKPKTTFPRLQTAASTTENQEISSNPLRSEPRNFIAPDWVKSRKIQNTAESAPTFKSVNAPLSYLYRTSQPLRQSPIATESLQERTPTTSLSRDLIKEKDITSPVFRAAARPFNSGRQRNKVTISFGTTTIRPSLPPQPMLPPQTSIPPRPAMRGSNKSTLRFDEVNPRSTSFGPINKFSKEKVNVNSKSTSNRFTPMRTSAPLPSPFDEDYEDTFNDFSNDNHPSMDATSKSTTFREMSKPDLKINSNLNRYKSANIYGEKIEILESKPVINTANWPKVPESSFLTNARDAVNSKKLHNVPKPVKYGKTEQLDMLRSPTESNGVIIDEPLKENISYRCRMMCTKALR